MELKFYKWSGAGNLFLIADGREAPQEGARDLPACPVQTVQESSLCPETITRLCRQHGTDGLIVLKGSRSCDFGMQFFNPDGSSGMMCGNGGRCIAAFANVCGVEPSREDGWYGFEGPDGVHCALVGGREGDTFRVRLGMKPVCGESVRFLEGSLFLDTGARHLVVPVPDVDAVDVASEGARLRSLGQFAPQGVNVDFVEWGKPIRIRTYEKGVEAETLACGTGITASALAASLLSVEPASKDSEGRTYYNISARGGDLEVDFLRDSTGFYDIFLTGPAEIIR